MCAQIQQHEDSYGNEKDAHGPLTDTGKASESNRWFLIRRTRPDLSTRLFCFPHAGGGASWFREWGSHLPDVEVVAIQLPGRETRYDEALIDRIDILLERLTAAIVPKLDRPYAFFGHSMGGLIAFELARALRRVGVRRPKWLFVSATPAPQVAWMQVGFPTEAETLEFMTAMGGTPDELLRIPELMQNSHIRLTADLSILRGYNYQEEPPLSTPIRAFYGAEDNLPVTSMADWENETQAAFYLHAFPGGHFFIDDHLPEILRNIRGDLAAIDTPTPSTAPAAWDIGGLDETITGTIGADELR